MTVSIKRSCRIVFATLLLQLSGHAVCQSDALAYNYSPPVVHKVPLPVLEDRFKKLVSSTRGMEMLPYIDDLLDSMKYTKEQAIKLLSNKTTMSYDKQHGTQISFYRGDGVEFLWYPGNSQVLRGQWSVIEEEVGFSPDGIEKFVADAGKICFEFGKNTYNPATKRIGEKECENAGIHEAYVSERQEGDVFGLANVTDVPFVLSRERTSLAALKKLLPKRNAPRE